MSRRSMWTGWPRTALVMMSAAVALLSAATPAAAAVPKPERVHSETMTLGGTTMTASFSDWPLRATRSLDFTFEPAGGIEGRRGTLRAVSPGGAVTALGMASRLAGEKEMTLVRHPRDYGVWGLDAVALPEEGMWRFEFTLHGPEGASTGTLALPVGPRPGPPILLSWTAGLLPWIIAGFWLTYRWIRSRPARRRIASAWSG
ncbi:hypothetical protein [Catenuloplanes atrovinosus]|uniref:YtkA-like domain-containing protein n=1 Tax=Catenuloplanes atrovinosus TaxID=137266 RepID=A0AAE3YPR9_9ACTN|nr:hypothetical protein [Catenuloplanes atrovinosus]MDR7276407.1 hypothetical protein [Catenuloplanes atrovinosus]